jgi:hypothetical protein
MAGFCAMEERPSPEGVARVAWAMQRSFSLGPPVFAAVIGIAGGFALSPAEASMAFYSASAEIIPVLLLTLAVQARLFQLPTVRRVFSLWSGLASSSSRADVDDALAHLERFGEGVGSLRHFFERTVLGVALLALLVAAQFATLHPLGTGEAADGNPEVVYIALATGFLMVGALAMTGGIEAVAPAPDEAKGDED